MSATLPKLIGALILPGVLSVAGLGVEAASAQPAGAQEEAVVQLTGGPPLSNITQVIVGPDSSVYLLDAMTDGVLEYSASGTFEQQIGRGGEGPGEVGSLWRIGLIGRDTLWAADLSLHRLTLFDARTGEPLSTLSRADGWGSIDPGATPLAVSATGHPILVAQDSQASPLNILDFEPKSAEAESIVSLQVGNRFMEVPLPDGGIQLRAPFSQHDKFAVDPWSRTLVVLRQTDATDGGLVVDPYPLAPDPSWTDSYRVALETEPLPASAIEQWLDKQRMMEDFVRIGLFPSSAAAREAFDGALHKPQRYPLIASRGQGVLEAGVIVDPSDPQGTVWIQRPTSGEEEVWQRLRPGDVSPRLRLAPREHLVAAFGEWIWVVQLDDFDVPTVTGRRVLLESEGKR